MRRLSMQAVCLIVAASRLMAADPVWKSKPAAEWTEEDAKQILAASPWAKENRAVITRRLTEDQLREGGQMGQPRGVGNEGVDPKGSGPKVSPNVFSGAGGDDRSPRSLPQPIPLKLRWESALPLQLAQWKCHAGGPPRVAVFLRENGLIVVYLFALSAEISKKDRDLRFEAQIGRIVVAQTFELSEMEFMGKLEL